MYMCLYIWACLEHGKLNWMPKEAIMLFSCTVWRSNDSFIKCLHDPDSWLKAGLVYIYTHVSAKYNSPGGKVHVSDDICSSPLISKHGQVCASLVFGLSLQYVAETSMGGAIRANCPSFWVLWVRECFPGSALRILKLHLKLHFKRLHVWKKSTLWKWVEGIMSACWDPLPTQ
jgi:hypothetical protein